MTSHGRAVERKFSGKQEAHLVAIACRSPPEGHVNWTLHLLADKVVEMEFAGSISLADGAPDTQKNDSSRGGKSEWCHPQVDAGSSARMEDVLDLYHEDYDRERPVVSFDESGHCARGPAPALPLRPPPDGWPAPRDTEYQRNGTRNLFMFCRNRMVEANVENRAPDGRGLRSTDEVAGGRGLSAITPQ